MIVFDKELSAEEVKEMSDGGLCSGVEDKHEGKILKWEEMLLKERAGNLIEVEVGCNLQAVIADLKKELVESRITSGQLENIAIRATKKLKK